MNENQIHPPKTSWFRRICSSDEMSENQNPPEKASPKGGTNSLVWGIWFFFLGIPLSYLFQPGLIRGKFSCGEYITHLPQMIADVLEKPKPDNLGVQVLVTLVVTCGVTGIIGALIGKAIDK